MANTADYARLDELLGHYYRTMTEKSPAWVKEKYTFEMLRADFAVLCILLYTSGMCIVFLPMLPAVPADHPLIKLVSIWPKRMGACNMAMGTHKYVKQLI